MPTQLAEHIKSTRDTDGTIEAPPDTTFVVFKACAGGGKGGDADAGESLNGGGGGGGGYAWRNFLCSQGDVVSWVIQSNGSIAVNVYTNSTYKGCSAGCGGEGSHLQAGVGGPAQGESSDAGGDSLNYPGGDGAPPGTGYGGGGGTGASSGVGTSATGQAGAYFGGGNGATATTQGTNGVDGGGGGGGALGLYPNGKSGSSPQLNIEFYSGTWGS